MVFWDQKQEKNYRRQNIPLPPSSFTLLPRDTELLYTAHNGLCAIGEHEF